MWFRLGSLRPKDAAAEFYFHHDHVLGTSLELIVVAGGPEEAESFEKGVLDEIERLRVILSTYDPASEISLLNSAAGPMACSPELIEVLRKYEEWTTRSGGALSGQLETLIATWKEAEKQGVEPDSRTLAGIVAQIQQPGWRIDEQAQTVTRLTSQALNVNAIGRGYILGKAAAAGRSRVPAVRGFLLDIGGDMTAWGENLEGPDWQVGVADPAGAQDNAPPLTRLRLTNGAVATSGPYQRFYTFGNKRYSHIFDPRTGRPAEGIVSATVMAPDTVTANALATTLCVLAPEEGLRLASLHPGVECLLVTADGRQMRSAGLKSLESPPAQTRAAVAQANPWPKDFQLTVTLTLAKPANLNRYRRPYVAVWLENDQGKAVRTLSVWGKQPRYYQDLSYWWKFAQGDRNLILSVTRATRPPGQYQLVWNGTDDQGNPVAQGTYTAFIEVHREHGKHVRQMGAIVCGAAKVSMTLAKTLETEEARVEYGPKGK
jgi:thiamine biosynthesis lipoprotein